ncbi:MAG TPA: metallophosphoesterase [Terriglobales bacterium]|jgi:predicted MPP superfamily phosphohydrolase|nr:metallophosphoesterase [Terriglobales bacterium]
MLTRTLNVIFLSLVLVGAGHAQDQVAVKLPLHSGSVRLAVIGDSGTGTREQYEIAQQLEAFRQAVKFDFVIMLGDNIYGGHSPEDFKRKFEVPYKPLLDAGVKFFASLGNHDDPNIERLYKPFNMNGERYYTFKRGDTQFYALDSTYMDARQLTWLEQNLRSSSAHWKICYFHHPLYNDGKMHGPDLDLRNQLTPLLRSYGVNAVFSGHEHAYERLKPQNGIYYFIQGDSGKLERHDFRRSPSIEASFDRDRTFMLLEIQGDELYFQTVSRVGKTVDSGVLTKPQPTTRAAASGK